MRWRLVAGLLAGVSVLLCVGGTLAYWRIRGQLYSEFEGTLIQRTAGLRALIKDEAGVLVCEWREYQPDPPGHERGLDYYAIWDPGNGERLAASTGTGTWALPFRTNHLDGSEVFPVALPGERAGRGVSLEFQPRRESGDHTDERPAPLGMAGAVVLVRPLVLIGARVDSVAATLAAIRRSFLLLGVCCVVVGALTIGGIVRRSLRSVEALTAQVGALDESAPAQRVTLQHPPTELVPIVDELNRLLERVEQALIRERALTSQVAHELRTPIAGLLSTLELSLCRLRSPEEYRTSTEECLEIAKRMHWLVSNLLSIARIDAGNVGLKPRKVDLAEVLPQWWDPFAARAASRHLHVAWAVAPEARLQTDPEFLRVVLSNLFDNAVSYTPEGGEVRIEARPDGTVSVTNDAQDLAPDLAERVFEPFWRNAGLRPEEAGVHTGLGLSLCRKILDLLGGRIQAQVFPAEQRFEVRLELA